METFRLLSMTDFVLRPKVLTDIDEIVKHAEITHDYAKFLKQPLTLSMFIPVSESGEVLEEPKQVGYLGSEGIAAEAQQIRLNEYQKAKDKIMFEGFEVHNMHDGVKRLTSPCGTYNLFWYSPVKGWYPSKGVEDYTIEHLVNEKLTLTPNALKLIYG